MLKSKSKMMTIVLLIGIIFVIAACSGNKEDTSKVKDNKPGAVTPTDNGTKGEGETKETVNLKIMGQFESSNLSETDKLFVESIEKATNTKIEFDIPPSTGYNERLQLMLTTGDFPDLVYFSSPSNAAFLNAVADNAIIPVNSYLEGAENVMKYTYDISWDALKVNNDENIYGLPRTSVIRSDGYFVRKDWLDKLNISIPADNQITLEQMTEILEKFSKGDPDGNNRDDTYGLAAYANGDKSMTPQFLDEHDYYGWQESNDSDYPYMTPKYDLNSDIYTNAMEFTAKLYKDGLMDPDAPLIDSRTALERFKSGRTGVLTGFAGNIEGILKDGKAINPDFDLTYVFVKNKEGEQKGLGQGTGLWGFWAITSEAKDPQRIVDIFDYMLSDEGWDQVYQGVEGHDYKVENNEKIYPEKSLDTFIRKNIVRRAGDYMFFINPTMPDEEKEVIVPLIQLAVERMVLSKDRSYTPSIARTPEYIDFNNKINEVTTRIIVGDASVDEYTKIVQEWHDRFGDEYLTEMNDYISKMENK